MKYVLDRLQEASTWRGVILFVTGVAGYSMPPEMLSQIVAAGVGLAGLVGMFTKDLK